MERPGRNDPCRCGSGRKYKRCCQPHEAERAAFKKSLQGVALPLLVRLARHAQSAAAVSLDTVAREDFPFWRGPVTRAQGARVVDHLMFDAPAKHGGASVAERFVREVGPSLDAAQRALLARWAAAARRPYRVVSWSGGFTECSDLLDDGAVRISVYDVEESWRPDEGELVALRPLPVEGAFLCAGPPIAFAERDPGAVAERIRRRHLDFVRSERIVGMDDFLRAAPTALDEEAARKPNASTIIVPGA